MSSKSSKAAFQDAASKLLQAVVQHKDAGPFLEPVRWKDWGLLDYPKVIRNPMDLGTVKVGGAEWRAWLCTAPFRALSHAKRAACYPSPCTALARMARPPTLLRAPTSTPAGAARERQVPLSQGVQA